MKKLFICVLIILSCFIVVGCGKKEEKEKIDDSWVLTMEASNMMLEEEVQNVFDQAKKDYKDGEITFLAYLGKQVVAGTNYMFLCQEMTKEQEAYKVIVVYKDLEGKVSITHNTYFNPTDYVSDDKNVDVSKLVGGWEVEVPGKPIMLGENEQEAFDKANEKMVGVSYYPIMKLATQEKDGTNVAILCYGRMADQDGTTGIYVQTISLDKKEILTIAGVDLKDFNK